MRTICIPFLAPYLKPGLTLIVILTLKPSLNLKKDLRRCEDCPKCPYNNGTELKFLHTQPTDLQLLDAYTSYARLQPHIIGSVKPSLLIELKVAGLVLSSLLQSLI